MKRISSYITKVKASEFIKNILIILSGNTFARLFPFIITPVLSRIYSPEDFALLGIFLSIVTITGSVSTAQYELAIVLPKADNDSFNLVSISFLINIFFSIIVFIIILFWNQEFITIINSDGIQYYIYIIPLVIFIITNNRIIQQWCIRKKYYREISLITIFQSSGISIIQCFLGFIHLVFSGLIWGNIIGNIILPLSVIKKLISDVKKNIKNISLKSLEEILIRYKKFPAFRIISVLFNTASQHLPILVFSGFYDALFVGYYSFSIRILGFPISIICNAVGSVFFEKAAKEYSENGMCVREYLTTLKLLIIISFPIFFILFLFTPLILSIIFGEKWHDAGIYLRILIPMYFLRFISSPLSLVFAISERLRFDLLWQFLLFILVIGGTIFVSKCNVKDIYALGYFSLSYSILYSLNMLLSFRFSKNIMN